MINKYMNRFILSNPLVMDKMRSADLAECDGYAIYEIVGEIFEEYNGYSLFESKIKTFILYIATKQSVGFGDIWFDDFIRFKYFFHFNTKFIPWWYRIYLKTKHKDELV